MDLLRVANEINTELVQIAARQGSILSTKEVTDIFNSVLTGITNDLLDAIELSVRDSRSGQTFLSWRYELCDRQYAKRIGPGLGDILGSIEQLPRDAHLACTPRWSHRFLALDERSREQVLAGTTWSGGAQVLGSRGVDDKEPGLAASDIPPERAMRSKPLESELLQIASETRLIDRRSALFIYESVERCLNLGHIQGIQLMISEEEREPPLLQWTFMLRPDLTLAREGQPLEQILDIAHRLKGRMRLRTKPIVTPKFDELPLEAKRAAMADTVWGHQFRRGSVAAGLT